MSKDLSKMISIGSPGYNQSPATMTGGVAVSKESVDPNIKSISWASSELKKLGSFKKKNKRNRRKKIVKAILLVKKNFPEVSIKEIIDGFQSRLQYKLDKATNPNKIDKDLLKAIIQSVRKSYPGLDIDNIMLIAEAVYKKKV